MKQFLMIASVWVLWLHSVRGNISLGEFSTEEECRTAIRQDKTHLLVWKTHCKESE
ncbi:hypothetical protein [Leptospira yasudae]|uniref:hypothetical protein n=1 Tax=Leptospira yasudae TaxID=2202201 RepID=UPI00142D8E12|nr:hypothetical protein [Leptospira yasudae]